MRFLFVIGFVLAFTTLGVSAQNSLIQCFTCSTEASFEAKIRLQGPTVEGTSYVYVANSNSGIIKKFHVRYLPGGYGDPTIFNINKVPVDTYAVNQFNQAMVYKSSIEDAFDYHKNVPEHIAKSAWQLGANPVFRQDVANFYVDNQTIRELIGNYTITLFTLGGKLVDANLLINVRFSDGSTADYRIAGVGATGELQFEFVAAFDNLGNKVPTSVGAMSGQYRMGEQTWSNYTDLVREFAYNPILTNTLQQVSILDCRVVPSTKEVVCDIKQNGSIP